MAARKDAQSVLAKLEKENVGFHCDLCSEDFESEKGLGCHIRMSKAHKPDGAKQGKFRCPVCSEEFDHEKGLSCHTRFSKNCKISDDH